MGSQTLGQGLWAMSGRSVVFPLGPPGIEGMRPGRLLHTPLHPGWPIREHLVYVSSAQLGSGGDPYTSG